MSRTLRIFLAAVFSTLFAGVAFADVIHLKNGNSISGRIIEKTETAVVVEVPYGTMTIMRRNIRRIESQSDRERLEAQGDELASLKAFDEAIKYYREALELPGANRPRLGKKIENAYQGLIRDYLDRRMLDRAEEAKKELLRFNPSSEAAGAESDELQKIRAEVKKEIARGDDFVKKGLYAKAVESYERALQLSPGARDVLFPRLSAASVKSAEGFLKLSDWSAAAVQYDRAIEYDPDVVIYVERPWVYCKARQVFDYLERGKLSKAEFAAETVLGVLPDNPLALFCMGEVYAARRFFERAARCYRKSLGPDAGDAPDDVIKLQEFARKKLVKDEKASALLLRDRNLASVDGPEWKERETTRFKIRHKSDYAAERLEKFAEHHAQHVLSLFDLENKFSKWDRKCLVELHPDKKSYDLTGVTPEWSGGFSLVKTRGSSLIDHRIILFQTSDDVFSRVLPHELTHVIIKMVVGYGRKIPLWLDEGAAVLMEPGYSHRNYLRIMAMELSRRNTFDLHELTSLSDYPPGERRALYYGQCYFLARTLARKGGTAKLVALARKLADGAELEKSLSELFKIEDLERLEKEYFVEMRKACRSCGFTTDSKGTSK